MRAFLTLRDFLWKHKHRYLFGLLCLVAVDALQLLVPRILAGVADAYQQGRLTTRMLQVAGLQVIGLAIVMAALRYGWRMYVNGTARLLEYTLRGRLFAHLERMSANYFNHHKVGDLMAHLTNDINAVRMAMGPGIVMITDSTFLLVVTLITMFTTIDVRLTAMGLAPLPLLAITVGGLGRLVHRRFRRVQEGFSDLTDMVQEHLSGVRVVKAFVQEPAQQARFTAINEEYVRRNLHLVQLWGLTGPLNQLIAGLGFLIALVYGGVLVVDGRISLGDFVAFNSYLGLLIWPMMAVGWVVNMLQRGAASMERLNVILNERPEITDAPDAVSGVDLSGPIEFRNLTFTYPGAQRPALEGISLRVEPGETVAIVGRTGSGKSTLVNLLLRLYDPPEGTVFIGGVDVRRIPLAELRKGIGMVPQENFLFSTTLADNIAFGLDRPAQEAEVLEAARVAQLDQDVQGFPQGYRTMVGERGVTLSGGQKQRVAIARALLKRPQILVLDDCLSAVDTATEDAILRGLQRYMRSRTSLVISHRLSAVKDADRIAVLEDGRLVEQGTHLELMARNGIYARTYRRQLLEERLAQEA